MARILFACVSNSSLILTLNIQVIARVTAKPTESTFSFLQGGGEMGELTRNYDWDNTSLGSPAGWPQSLRTTISILLSSQFPRFLFWGKEHICFYNDAYRPSLGNNGKHPAALGQKGEECWPEIWPVIKPLIDQVLSGQGATWSEDQLLPIYRNGRLEDVYWTFSYMPVNDESGDINGVLVVCTETTAKVLNIQKLAEREQFARNLFNSSVTAQVVFTGRDMVIYAINQKMLDLIGRDDSVIDKPFIKALPELADTPLLSEMQQVLDTGKMLQKSEDKYELVRYGKPYTGYYNYTYEILLNEAGEKYGIICTAIEVTEQVLARINIEKSESRFRRLIQEANFACALFTGKDMVIEVANNTMVGYWGKGHSVIGKPLTKALPELVGQPFPQIVDEVYITGKTFAGQDLKADLVVDGIAGSYYFDITYTALRNEDGEIYGVMNTAIDVTEKVLGRRRIEQAEERLRLAVESAGLGTYEIDLVTNEMLSSERFQMIWGTGNSVTREEFAAVIHPEDRPARLEALRQSLDTGNLQYEARIIWKDGSAHWVRVRGAIMFDNNNKPHTLIGVIQDINEQKNFAEQLSSQVKQRTAELEIAQHTLLEANAYQQAVINKFETALASLVPVYEGEKIVDFSFKTTNTAYSFYSKVSPQEIQGRKVSDIFPGYYRTEAFDRYVNTFETGRNNEWELHYNLDELNVYLQIMASKMGEEVVVNFSDVTAMKQLQLDLLQNIKELKRSNDDLQQFAHVASHDLKEPVRKIRMFGNRLLGKEFAETLPKKAKEYLEKIENAASRMTDMIDGVLLYSSAGATGQLEEQVNLHEVLRNIETDLEALVQQKGAVLTYSKLPVIGGSQMLLHQLFYNLVLNSLKFSRQDVPPVITITCDIISSSATPAALPLAGQEHVSIRLQDNGIGFGQDQAQYIFKTFSRLHAKDKYEGSGIGLALCRKIAERHGGTIEAEGKEGSGAIFTVILPLQQL